MPFVCRLQDGGLSPPGFVPYWSSRLKETVAVSNIVLVHTVTLTTWHHPSPPFPPTTLQPLCSQSFKVDHVITRARDESKQNVRYIKRVKHQAPHYDGNTFIDRMGQTYFSLLRNFNGIRAHYVNNWGFVLHKNYPVLKSRLKCTALKFFHYRIKTSGNLNTFILSVVLRINYRINFRCDKRFYSCITDV